MGNLSKRGIFKSGILKNGESLKDGIRQNTDTVLWQICVLKSGA